MTNDPKETQIDPEAACVCGMLHLGAIAPGHNPDQLTQEQVGIADGWRLLREEEIVAQPTSSRVLESWLRFGSWWSQYSTDEWERTYRTKLAPEQLRQARGLSAANREEVKPCADCQPSLKPTSSASDAAQTSYPDAPPVPAPAQTPEELEEEPPEGFGSNLSEGLGLFTSHEEWFRQALAAKDEELAFWKTECAGAKADCKQIDRTCDQLVTKCEQLTNDLAAERAKREEAERERDNWSDTCVKIAEKLGYTRDIADEAEKAIGSKKVSDGMLWMVGGVVAQLTQRAEQAEARLAECQKARDVAEASARWINGVIPCSSVVELSSKLPPDILMAPMPFPDRMDYAAKMIQATFEQWIKEEGALAAISTLKQQLAQASEQLAKVTEQMNAAVKSWRQGQEQLVAEAAKYSVLIAIFKSIRGGWVLQHEVAKLIDAAISSEPHAALQRYGLEVAERACKEAVRVMLSELKDSGFVMASDPCEVIWLKSQTRASLTGQTDGKGEA